MNTVNILGVPFTQMNFEETRRHLVQALQGEAPVHIVTAGPELVMRAVEDPGVMQLLHGADLVTPDGIGAVWASKYYGHQLRDRVTGMELSTALIEQAAADGLRVYLLGAAPHSNELALQNLRARYPALKIAGRDGYFSAEEERDVVAEVSSFAPHLLLVGLGQPRQEAFIQAYKCELGASVLIGIGGVIDVYAGTVKRAPVLWQKMKLEWLYRLLRQPSRWRRQLVLPRFVLAVLGDKRNHRRV